MYELTVAARTDEKLRDTLKGFMRHTSRRSTKTRGRRSADEVEAFGEENFAALVAVLVNTFDGAAMFSHVLTQPEIEERRIPRVDVAAERRTPVTIICSSRWLYLKACRSSVRNACQADSVHLDRGLLMAALVFPFVGGAGAVANRLSDVVAQDSAQLLEGEVPIISTMVDAAGNPIAWIFTQRRWVVPGNRIADTMKLAIVSIEDRRFGVHNGVDLQGSLTGLAGYLRGAVDTRGGSTIEQQYVKNYNLLVNAQNGRRAAGGDRDHADAQAARDADGAGTRQGALQAGDPDPVSEPGVVRQRQLRRAGSGEDLLRCQCSGAQLAAVGAAGRDGAVHERAQPLHQPRRSLGATQSRARHPDREPARTGPTRSAPPRRSRWASCPSPTRCRRAASGRAIARSSAITRCPISRARASTRSEVARNGYLIRTTLDPKVQDSVKRAIDKVASPTSGGRSRA